LSRAQAQKLDPLSRAQAQKAAAFSHRRRLACGATVPGEKRSFANHYGLEAETGREGRRAFPMRRSFSQDHMLPEEIGREGGQSQARHFANGDAVGKRRTLRTGLNQE
jgi:general stress protein YciG